MVELTRARRIAIDTLEARLLGDLRPMLDDLLLEDLASPLRFIKSPEEIALARESVRFADICLERLLAEGANIISQGGTELDLMADCVGVAKAALKAAHGEVFAGTKMGITATVHSGPRAALPHGNVIARRPQRGEPVIAGIGASLGGYHSESGVTIVVGELSAEHRRVMTAMQACNDGAIAALVPGNTCDAVNAAAMAPLEAADLGAAIRHRIGHGMGVEGHEAPWLNPGEQTPIAAGMVFSNEPGVYRPNRDGYRTINTMIVHADRVEIPSRFQTNHPIADRVFAL
jgi:Xaa-Pro aminopeptidase